MYSFFVKINIVIRKLFYVIIDFSYVKCYKLSIFQKLHRVYTGIGLSQKLFELNSVKDEIKYVVDFTERVTGIKNFGPYLTRMLEFDAFFLNEDRHTNNIALLYNNDTGKYKLSPYFDAGLSLMSDTTYHPLYKPVDENIKTVNSRPFSSFEKQVNAARELYGSQLHLDFNKSDVKKLLSSLSEYYDRHFISRIRKIFEIQFEKYPEFFTGEPKKDSLGKVDEKVAEKSISDDEFTEKVKENTTSNFKIDIVNNGRNSKKNIVNFNKMRDEIHIGKESDFYL